MMQRTANENAAYKRRICKRSDQPKIDRITNNARLILREKLNGATWFGHDFPSGQEMLHFVTSYMEQNKSHKQTLESAQYRLEISFKSS